MNGPLHGIRVIELGRYISGPFAGRMLSDLGAEVIKVEDPRGGDPVRDWEASSETDTPSESGAETDPLKSRMPQFKAYNKGKKSVALDIKSDDGLERLLALIETADVLIHNFRPGVTARLGIDFDDVRERNPRLVYCSLTGFGEDGPYAQQPSYDTVVSGLSGLYSLLIDIDETTRLTGPAISDLVSGMFAAQGVLAALVSRASTGRGQRVDTNMVGSMITLLAEHVQTYLDTGQVTTPYTRLRRGGGFAMKGSDGLPFVIHLSVPARFWEAFCEAFEQPELRDDPRFHNRSARYENYFELANVLAREALRRPRHEWLERLARHSVPHAQLNDIGEALRDPQVRHLAALQGMETSNGPEAPCAALTFSETPLRVAVDAPRLGEHDDAV
jgi:crotonobetainyl-CoA:carnitine CoA-transferase CaiB-like acyl-CoA transferase